MVEPDHWGTGDGAARAVHARLTARDAFDFTVYDSYRACRIDKVHAGVRADA